MTNASGRAGLIIPQGEHRAGFYHLSFQAFFAAQRLADGEPEALAQTILERGAGPAWRNTLSFLDGKSLPADPMLGFIEIPAGPFTMGSDKRRDRKAFDDELPAHSVTLPAFFIARFPVTVAQFRAYVEEAGITPGDPDCLRGVANHPVANVSWPEALTYCNSSPISDRL